MGISKLSLLGYGLLAWSGIVGMAAVAWATYDSRFGHVAAPVAVAGGTGGLVLCIIGAARHEDI